MKVSILIPSFNHARFLEEALASVRAQTHPDWEAILVDDGSLDESVAIARRHAVEDARIQVHVNPSNLGTYGAQQRALTRATGPFVAILNSDDAWAPEKLAIQVSQLEAHPECAFAYARGALVDENGMPYRTQNQHADWPLDPIQSPLPRLLEENRILASSVLFRREGLRFDPTLRYSGDWVALLAASRRGKAAFAEASLSTWRQHRENTFQRSKGQVLEEFRVRQSIERHRMDWLALGLPQASVEAGLDRNRLHLQALALLAGDRRLARKMLRGVRSLSARTKGLRLLATYLPAAWIRKRFGDGQALGLTPADLACTRALDLE